ncbi:MAG TPA: LysM peptidoglycan-binding domain-containing protein [Anaerolineales bacterium]|nr:LysM peptidoglycan-binding domain-containing protein [Anaerolineales bacterium]
MPITHEQARNLIQLNLDQTLSREESATLIAHLSSCRQCAAYASEIKEVTNLLARLMKRQWNVQPVPLSARTLIEKSEKLQSKSISAMRTAAASLVVMALFFSAWQFVISVPSPSSQLSSAIPPAPTPSNPTIQTVSTDLTREDCAIQSYTVQEQDTLASIAKQFSVSEQTILEVNLLEAESVRPAMELIIPVCHFTPTGTFHAVTFTTTLTPVLNFKTSTPGG